MGAGQRLRKGHIDELCPFQLVRGGLGRIRVTGNHCLDHGFGGIGFDDSRALSLALACLIEITERPCVPKVEKMTANVLSLRRPIAMCRP